MQSTTFRYPKTKKVNQLDTYHGVDVADPYRWLEQPYTEPEVSSWIKAQNELTYGFLETISERQKIKERLTELWNFPKAGAPFKKGKRYFQFRNTGLQNQHVLYVMTRPDEPGEVLLDPNTLSNDGTAALNNLSVSPDGRFLAFAVSESGSDWQSWFIRDIETGKDLPEKLEWSKFSGATWLPDGSGFIYGRFPEPKQDGAYTEANAKQQLFLHKLHSAQSQDELIYENPEEPQWMAHTITSDDDRYLLLHISRDTSPVNLIYYRELNSKDAFKPLIADWEAAFYFLGNDGNTFYFQTTYQADRGKVIAIDIAKPEKDEWQTIVPESNDTLQAIKFIGDQFVCLYLHHASNVLKRLKTDGSSPSDINLPTLGTVEALNANRDDTQLFYSFTSFLYPSLSFEFNLDTGVSRQLNESALKFDASLYETSQVFATSKDGTQVPIFLVHKKDLEKNGQNPCLLYGYGGFNISLSPSFSVSRLAWLELGGILAVANLRGGGEYGKAWHQAGTLDRKQNVFNDFIASAEYLIEQGYTAPAKLAIQGGSNGGLLVGAAMTQRPELFGAALPAVGVMDMLRFHLFTIGWAWVSDYGSSADPEQFKSLFAYSPLHNLRPANYPATLITTGDHDDRVVPGHSFKFAATLQEAQQGTAPTLIRIQTKAGHGAGKPTTMLIEEQADIWGFLVRVLNINSSETLLRKRRSSS
ncbi:MAG: S9 family peptidase [Trueperaceae bacterium]|nr:S9 family peptidase [Trueperaceae bacterium]